MLVRRDCLSEDTASRGTVVADRLTKNSRIKLTGWLDGRPIHAWDDERTQRQKMYSSDSTLYALQQQRQLLFLRPHLHLLLTVKETERKIQTNIKKIERKCIQSRRRWTLIEDVLLIPLFLFFFHSKS